MTSLEVGEASRKVFHELCGFDALPTFFNEEFCSQNSSKFDLVILSQVIEHLSFEKDPLKDIRSVLKGNGVVCSLPKFRLAIGDAIAKTRFLFNSPRAFELLHKNYDLQLTVKRRI